MNEDIGSEAGLQWSRNAPERRSGSFSDDRNAVPVPFWENGSSKLGPARSAAVVTRLDVFEAGSNSAAKNQCTGTGYPGIDRVPVPDPGYPFRALPSSTSVPEVCDITVKWLFQGIGCLGKIAA